MNINEQKLSLFYPKGLKYLHEGERFYNVPGASGYGLSGYCRLCHRYIDSKGKPKTRIEKVIHTSDSFYAEAYSIKFDSEDNKRIVPIVDLLKLVFFPTYNGAIGFKDWESYKHDKYIMRNIILLKNKDDWIEYISAKVNHREFNISKEKTCNSIIQQAFEGQQLYKKMRVCYHSAKMRATNKKMKDRTPSFADSSMCAEWLNSPDTFYDWYLSHLYYYPDDKLVIDKDLMNFGETMIYSPELASLIPFSINKLITRDASKNNLCYGIQTRKKKDGSVRYEIPSNKYPLAGKYIVSCDKYSDALLAGRKKRAKHIRCVAELERQKGYLPKIYIDKLLMWANRCELGLIKMFEPTQEVIDKLA